MKKTLIFTLSLITVIATALLYDVDPIQDKMNALVEKHKTEDLPEAIRKLALAEGIPAEEIIKRLEGSVRSAMFFATNAETNTLKMARENLYETERRGSFRMLEAFHGTNTISLLREFILAKTDLGFAPSEMAIVLINIEGTNAIPFLRDTMSVEQGYFTDKNRNALSEHLEKVTAKLNEENKTNDVEKFTVFLNEMKQAQKPKEVNEN